MTAVSRALGALLSVTLLGPAFLTAMPLSARAGEPGTGSSKNIRDNLFLLEEGYNQEPGVIQHIQSFSLNPQTDSWNYSFTEEWPVLTDRHQLSLTAPAMNQGRPGRTSVGDFLLSYRLQAIGAGGAGPLAVAPRLSLVLPTGESRTGFGRGSTGLQFNLPVSIELGSHFVTHLNAGFTFTPRAKSLSGYSAAAIDTNAGAALAWLPLTWINPLVEIAHVTTHEIREDKTRSRRSTMIVNPGVRFAVNCGSGLQIVPGISTPIQFDGNRTGVSVLFYLSLEHPLRRPR